MPRPLNSSLPKPHLKAFQSGSRKNIFEDPILDHDDDDDDDDDDKNDNDNDDDDDDDNVYFTPTVVVVVVVLQNTDTVAEFT